MSRDVGVGQLVEELEQRGDRLPFEIGAFVALEACEGLLQEAVKLDADDVRVTLEGSVLVAGSAERAEPDEAARSLVSVLARLLVAAGPGVPPYLLDLVEESAAGTSSRDLRNLHDAIEASLIPINRGASRRVLARLVRESDRPPAAEVPQVDPQELDAELDELLRDPISRDLESASPQTPPAEAQAEEEPVTERIRIPRSATPDAVSVTATETDAESAPVSFPPPVPDESTQPETLPVPPSQPALARASAPVPDLSPPPAAVSTATSAAFHEQPPQPGPEPITATIRKWQPQDEPAATSLATATESMAAPDSVTVSGTVSVSEATRESEAELETVTESAIAPAPVHDRASIPEPRPPKRRGGWGVWILAAALGLAAYGLISTGTLDDLLKPTPPVAAPAPGGMIEVSVTPADAQIFVFVGRGPAVASGLPTQNAHEFVVFDSGLRPSRAIVPKDASWSLTERGSLYELAVQAQPVEAPEEALNFGEPATVPASVESANLGTIRIITNPPGAKVYRFVGLGPTVRISASSIHEGQEILVYDPIHETRRAVIGPSDWQPGDGGYAASLDVVLPALPDSVPAEVVED